MDRETFDNLWRKHHEAEFLKHQHSMKMVSTNRPDLRAMILLDQLVPGTVDILSSASHDEVWFEIEPDALAAVITEEQIIELIRCGVRYDEDSLCMFV